MAGINSYDACLAGISVDGKDQDYQFNKASITTVANSIFSLWTANGQPGTGAFGGTPLAARAVTGATTGAMRFTNPTAPDTLHLLSFGALSTVAAGTLFLLDRLLDYPTIDCTSTSLQTLDNTVTLPRYTTGAGVRLFAEVTTTLGATPQTMTLTYTNSDGTGSRVTTLSPTVSAAVARVPQAGLFIPLAAGDHAGLRSVQSVQFGGSMGAGVLNLTLCRPMRAELPLPSASFWQERNLVQHVPRVPRVFDDAALMMMLAAATTSSGDIKGQLFALAR